MATTSIATVLSTLIKTRYPEPEIMRLIYKDSPGLGMIRHRGNAPPEFSRTVEIAGQAGSSSNFTVAQANIGQPSAHRFTINSYADEYGMFRLNGQMVAAAMSRLNTVAPDIIKRANGAFYSVRHSMGRALYGKGSGSIGQVASGGGTATITLTNAADAVNFHVGMVIAGDTVDGGGTVGTNVGTITAVNVQAGTITQAGTWDATDFAANNYIFRQGDYDAKFKGLGEWFPDGTPAALWGVTRTVDRVRLAGWDETATQDDGTLERFFLRVSSDIQTIGGAMDCIFMNTRDWAYWVNQLGSRAAIQDMAPRAKEKISVNYKALEIMGVSGAVKVMADPFCPKGKAWAVTLETLNLNTLQPKLIQWLDHDNLGNIVRLGDADAVEGRVGSYVQFDSEAPGYNAFCDISALVEAA